MGSMQVDQIELHATELEYYKLKSVPVKEDFNSLFNVVQGVLKHATSVAEKCLLEGKNEMIIIENKSVPIINCALNILKRIYCTVACEADSKRDVSASIMDILSTYSGAERAVLTLAAFALSYGELLFYIDRQQLNPFALLISSLRRVDEIITVHQEDQCKTAISNLNGLTKLTLELVGFILELDSLSKKDYIDDLSVVTEITAYVERYSFLAIQVVVACMTQVNYLTYDRVATAGKGLSSLASILKDELTTLKQTVEKYKSVVAEWEAYGKLHTSFFSHNGIIDVFTCLMYPLPPYLDYCHIEKRVRVDQLLKGKNVLLFISEPDISDADFEILDTIHKELEKEHHDYKIVWIPVVEQWTPESIQKFNYWKKKMSWYVVCYETSTPIVGIKYIKRRWQFSFKPMVVVLNSHGAIECLDAIHMIRAWGRDAFPFTIRPIKPDPCMGPIIFNLFNRQIEKEKYIFLYGGKEEWIDDFGANVDVLASDTIVSSKISLTSFAVGVENSNMEIEQFWTRMESLLYVRMQWNVVDDATKHIQKLLSFQNEDGWALLCKGSTILACASGTLVKEAVVKYKEWTKYLGRKKFEICLQEYFDPKPPESTCLRVAIQSFNGWLPVDVKCSHHGFKLQLQLRSRSRLRSLWLRVLRLLRCGLQSLQCEFF